jgi:tRNA-splicing ligase RtcB (3'-phosphate/5'-hydroxy nucleic acid ligase)
MRLPILSVLELVEEIKKRVDDPVLDRIQNAPFTSQRNLLGLAEEQLGTVGAGNHYVDLFKDEGEWIWVGVHFGSRGFGHRTATGFLALAQGRNFGDKASEGEMDSSPILFKLNSDLGQAYLSAMELAGEYAYAGRRWVVNQVLKILNTYGTEFVHNHHNFAWPEIHWDEKVHVIRKGCTPAFPGQRSFIGGSMGDNAVIVEGMDSLASREALYSTIHGAGRIMSRTQAAGKREYIKTNKGKVMIRKGGLVNWDQAKAHIKAQGIDLRGGGADEAPEVYKKLDEVLAYHSNTIKIIHTLTPIGVAMAGTEEIDPYKD